MSLFDQVMGGLQGAANLYAQKEGVEAYKNLADTAMSDAQAAATDLSAQAQFKPFTVTSSLGTASTSPSGGVSYNLTPEQQAIANQLTSAGTGMIGGATPVEQAYAQLAGDFGVTGVAGQQTGEILGGLRGQLGMAGLDPTNRTREADLVSMLTGGPSQGDISDIYNQMEAIQAPQRERDRLNLEQRLYGQGRSGVRSAMYGGTPEELAMAKAREEAMAGNAFAARQMANQEYQQDVANTLRGIQQAQAETGMLGNLGMQGAQLGLETAARQSAAQQAAMAQALGYQGQQAGLGLDYLQASYLPQQQMVGMFNPAINVANIAGTGQRQGADIASRLIQAGLQTRGEGQETAAKLERQYVQGLADLLTGTGGDDPTAGLISTLLGGRDPVGPATASMTGQDYFDLMGL